MIGKRPGAISVMNKSQTLPRNMGGRAMTNGIGAVINKNVPKPLQTPPAIRRQFSVKFYFSLLIQLLYKTFPILDPRRITNQECQQYRQKYSATISNAFWKYKSECTDK